MADSLSISPVALFSPAGIPPVALALPANGTPVPAIPSVASRDSVVDLSANGQLLSAVFTFRSALEALPLNTADNSPATLAATAQSLVDAFTALQNSSTSPPGVTVTPAANALAGLLSPPLDALATEALISDADTLFGLQDIGINLLSATATTPPAVDQTALSNAIAADPVAARTTLATATQSLIEQAGTLEADVLSTVIPPAIPFPFAIAEPATVAPTGALPQPGTASDDHINIGTIINPQPVPPVATPLPAVAAAPPAVEPTPAAVPDDAVTAEVLTLPLSPTELPDVVIANTSPANQMNPSAATTSAASPPPTVPLPAITAPIPTPAPVAAVPTVTPSPLAADVIDAERRASANAIALQTLLSDPRQRALDNHLNPAYSAVIAASHLSDFDSPRPFTDARALDTDTIGPVSALVRARAIADYREAAGEAEQRTLIGTSTTRQYWV